MEGNLGNSSKEAVLVGINVSEMTDKISKLIISSQVC